MTEPEFFHDLEQGTPEWYELRRGIPTASNFQTILVDKDGAQTLMYRLAGEILSGELTEGFSNASMARGTQMESEARDHFARSRLLKMERCGFVRRRLPTGRYVGCSPDSFFDGPNGKAVLEIKTQKQELMIKACESGLARHDETLHELPTQHKAQCMGALWVTGFRWVELMVWYRGMPWANHYACMRDESYIQHLANKIVRFDERLHAMVQKYGGA